MKICFIVGAFPNMKCGIGDYTAKLANELANTGNEISVITSKNASKASNEKIKIYNIIDAWNFRNLKKIINKLKEIKPDVVNIQYPSSEYKKNLMINFLPFFIKINIKCTLVETIHEYSVFTILGKIRNNISLKKADEVIVVEEEYIPMIDKINKKAKVLYIPIAANIKQSKLNSEQILKLREELKIGNNKLISYFGFANETKGIEKLFYAIKDIPDSKLLFIAELNKDNEYQNKLLELMKELEIADRVIITGFLQEEKVADYLKCSDVCVLPFRQGVSKRNGSFLAAYNQDIPVVTTSKDKTYIKDNVYYVQTENRDELIENIKIALDKKESTNREIISWKTIASKYMEVVEEKT